jgi:hypothetical protein
VLDGLTRPKPEPVAGRGLVPAPGLAGRSRSDGPA